MDDPATDAYPGWTRIEAELKACAGSGDDAKLSAVEAMAVLGEVQRLRDRLDWATRLLRAVKAGTNCWGSQQGYDLCEFSGVAKFLGEKPKRRRWWWRR